MSLKPQKKHSPRRVDIQVSLLVAVMVVLSSICIYIFGYQTTYNDMLVSLTERVDSIYNYLEQELCTESFEQVNTKEDMTKPCYTEMKEIFTTIKSVTGVQYLYTAKRADDGQLVYVIDGLDSTAADFRSPGDPIEPEIVDSLNRALSGERVLPDEIKHTDWGDIFITYLPIHGADGSVLGTIGIEFAATHQYKTYATLRRSLPIVILAACVISAVLALIFFRRISNPHYQDLANTDWLTKLKNRNAYELDTMNLCAMGAAKGTGILLADLNGLKKANDTLGHEAGDAYIKAMALSLQQAATGDEVLYRIGGDEFVVIIPHATEERTLGFTTRLAAAFATNKTELMPHASYSLGGAICDSNDMAVFDRAYHEADQLMYHYKKIYYDTVRSE